MHSALFVAELHRSHPSWSPFLSNVHEKTQQIEGIARLGENVWLLDLTTSVEALGVLIYQSHILEIRYAIIPFDEKPQWLPASYSPTTTPAHSE